MAADPEVAFWQAHPDEPPIGQVVDPVRSSVIESTGLVNVGTAPGECWGWECALCDSASGLAWGDPTNAARALVLHLAVDCRGAI